MAAADFTFWSNDASIDFDIRKEFNAKLDGKRAKTFFKTNQRPIPNPSYKNYSRKIELPYENDIRYNKFHNKIDLDNISDFNIHALAPNRTITQNQMDMTLKELAQDYINRTPNMFNGLEPFRSGLKKEPIIGPGHYLRGLLEDKALRSSTGALVPGVAAVVDPVVDPLPPLPPSPPPPPPPRPGPLTRSLTREIARRSAQRANDMIDTANKRPLTKSYTTAQLLEASLLTQRPGSTPIKLSGSTPIPSGSGPSIPSGSITSQGIVNPPKIGKPVISSSTNYSPEEQAALNKYFEEQKDKKIRIKAATKIQAVVKGKIARDTIPKAKATKDVRSIVNDIIDNIPKAKATKDVQSIVNDIVDKIPKRAKAKAEAAQYASSSKPKPKEDDSGNDSGETNLGETITKDELATRLGAWGIPEEQSKIINFKSAQYRHSLLTEIAYNLFSKNRQSEFIEMVLEPSNSLSTSKKRKAKQPLVLAGILQELKSETKPKIKPAKSTAK